MERIAVSSSNIASAGFDETTHEMEIGFKRKGGGESVYSYPNVTHAQWADFLQATSKGTWFSQNLRGNPNHPATKIG